VSSQPSSPSSSWVPKPCPQSSPAHPKPPPPVLNTRAFSRRFQKCAHPKCAFLVHSKPCFGGFCCKKCFSWLDCKKRPQHGERCEGRPAPLDAEVAELIPPDGMEGPSQHFLDWYALQEPPPKQPPPPPYPPPSHLVKSATTESSASSARGGLSEASATAALPPPLPSRPFVLQQREHQPESPLLQRSLPARWTKYLQPSDSYAWWCRDDGGAFFFECEPGPWRQFRDEETQKLWWWNEENDESFFE